LKLENVGRLGGVEGEEEGLRVVVIGLVFTTGCAILVCSRSINSCWWTAYAIGVCRGEWAGDCGCRGGVVLCMGGVLRIGEGCVSKIPLVRSG
jgi:hypothetical protein